MQKIAPLRERIRLYKKEKNSALLAMTFTTLFCGGCLKNLGDIAYNIYKTPNNAVSQNEMTSAGLTILAGLLSAAAAYLAFKRTIFNHYLLEKALEEKNGAGKNAAQQADITNPAPTPN